jgi:hypothetical protein
MPIGGVQVLFKRQKQLSPPLGFGLPWMLKCSSCNPIATNEQLKDLTHMFCLRIPCYKLYEKGLIFYVFTLKYMCHKSKKYIYINKFHGYFLVNLILCFPT